MSIEKFRLLSLEKRYKYDVIVGHSAHELLCYIHPESIRITLFRDPIERIVSLYYYVKQCKKHPLHSIACHRKMNLERWINLQVVEDRVSNFYIKYFLGKSPSELIHPVEDAVNLVKENYHIIGVLDRISDFVDTIQDKALLKCRFKNTKLNVTKNRPVVDTIPSPVLQEIRNMNYFDIAFYKKIKLLE